jgi:hypothetical protein
MKLRAPIAGAVLGVVLAMFTATSAFALPAPVLSGPNGSSGSGRVLITGDEGTGLILGGSSNFGASLASQQAVIGVTFGPSGGGGQQNDNFRRKHFMRFSTQNDVPEPASIWLLGSGLGIMWIVSRRKRESR